MVDSKTNKYQSDNGPIISTDIHSTGLVRMERIYHAFGGFQNQAATITIANVNDWYWVTNAENNLWTGIEADEITVSGDIMTINKPGDYIGSLSMTFSALNGKYYNVRVYNITQAKQEGYLISQTTTGAANFSNVCLPLYFEDVNAGDTFRVEVQNVTDATDPTFKSAVFYLSYLHD